DASRRYRYSIRSSRSSFSHPIRRPRVSAWQCYSVREKKGL
ncbi:MAG: hypothetical protein AVDCRST_MAG14-1353, partial [uncultured Rubrobacteraceae bacterium]